MRNGTRLLHCEQRSSTSPVSGMGVMRGGGALESLGASLLALVGAGDVALAAASVSVAIVDRGFKNERRKRR